MQKNIMRWIDTEGCFVLSCNLSIGRFIIITVTETYKKAELSQRWPQDGCPENFRESLSTPTATFREISNRLLFRSILWMCVQNLKFVALPVPNRGYAKMGSPWIRPRSLFSKFLMGFCSDGPCDCTSHIWSPYFHPIDVLGGGCEPPILGKETPLESGWYRSKERWWVPIGLHSNFSSIFTRFRDIASFVFKHATFFFFPPHL